MVVHFLRSKIRLNEYSVGLILHLCFGGNATCFKVVSLRNWSFKFQWLIEMWVSISTTLLTLPMIISIFISLSRTMEAPNSRRNLRYIVKSKMVSGLLFLRETIIRNLLQITLNS